MIRCYHLPHQRLTQREQPEFGVLGRRGPEQPGGVLDRRGLGVGVLA
jgi:hypothetical protein